MKASPGLARRLWAKALALGRRAKELCPLTASGGAVLAASASVAWFYGVGKLDLILLTSGIVIAVLLVLLAVTTPLTALFLRRRRRGATVPQSIFLECGAWSRTGFRARAPRWLPFLSLEAQWESPPEITCDIQGRGGEEMVFPRRRGVFDSVVRRLTLTDVLGLTAVTWREKLPVSGRILPGRAALDRTAVLTGIVLGEEQSDPRGEPFGDRVEMRKYGHGDSPRMILWKIYARTRKLFVRVPERALEPAPRVCAYLVTSEHDEPAACLARTVLERQMLGGRWRFGADGAEDASDMGEALHALALSGSRAFGLPTELEAYLGRAARDGFGACLLMAPAVPGPWAEGVRAAIASSRMRLHVALALPGWSDEKMRPWWKRAALRDAPATGLKPKEVGDLIRSLAADGVRFTLVDTKNGRVLHDPEEYLARAAKLSSRVAA